jgi:putative hydrolase of the HAD superfamily
VAINNIIFDLVGIFLKVNYQKTKDAFIALGVTNFDDYYKQDFVSKPFEDIELGLISTEEFYNGVREITGKQLLDKDIEYAWNAMLEEFWLDRLRWLNEINKRYNVYLFSNTNKIHYDWLLKSYEQLNTSNLFHNYFIKDYYSHILQLRKPTIESYNAILNEQNLVASETLFVDDTLKNIEGAKLAGLQTLHLNNSMNLITEVNKMVTTVIL